MNKMMIKTTIFGIIGATLGFLYYKFIGCHSGACPITSNPWISTAYGLIFGILLGYPNKEKMQKIEMENKQNEN